MRVLGGSERYLTAEEAQAIYFNEDKTQIVVDSSDFGLDQQNMNLVIKISSEYSIHTKRSARLTWNVQFWDICWDAQL